MIELSCAFTGHRILPPDFPFDKLHSAIEELAEEGYRSFLCGMAMGFDLAALECLIDIKERYHVRVEACIPHAGQEKRFPLPEQKRYNTLLDACDRKTVLSDDFYLGCMQARNRYMVERADLLFAYCVKKTGGSAYTVNFARQQGVEVRLFEP